jgi:hypothetical protein
MKYVEILDFLIHEKYQNWKRNSLYKQIKYVIQLRVAFIVSLSMAGIAHSKPASTANAVLRDTIKGTVCVKGRK